MVCTIPHPNPNGCSCHERQGVWKQICKGGILSSLAIYDHHWNNVENKANKANFPHDDLFRGIIPGFSDGTYDHHQNNIENKEKFIIIKILGNQGGSNSNANIPQSANLWPGAGI